MSFHNKRIFVLMVFLVSSISLYSEVIGTGLTGTELHTFVVNNYKTSDTLNYNDARDVLYGEIDLQPGNLLECIYSGFTIVLNPDSDPTADAYNKGINCEHTWPQSFGADNEPQKSDMHHLFPSEIDVNAARGNDPFADIPDNQTDRWYRNGVYTTVLPTSDINLYSEKELQTPNRFEPRESKKGDIARAMLYFYCMYEEPASEAFWDTQKNTLLQWHQLDPADESELQRTWEIAEYQQEKPNPFILDNTLAQRI